MPLDKVKARNHALKLISLIPNIKWVQQNKIITDKLVQHPWVKRAQVIGGYFPLKKEINLVSFFNICLLAKKTLLMPKIANNILNYYLVHNKNDFSSFNTKSWNIHQHFLLWNHAIDLLIIPCIAFNKKNYRIGSGKGHFDRYLKHSNVKTIGIAWWNCLLDFEAEDHDAALNLIIH